MKKITLVVAFMGISLNALAGQGIGKIDFVQSGHGYTTENAYVVVKIDAPRTSKPACATDDRMAINPSTEAGKVIVSMLLAANAASQTVEVYGSNSCSIMGGDFENISYVRVR